MFIDLLSDFSVNLGQEKSPRAENRSARFHRNDFTPAIGIIAELLSPRRDGNRRGEGRGRMTQRRVNKNDYLFQNIYNIKKTF